MAITECPPPGPEQWTVNGLIASRAFKIDASSGMQARNALLDSAHGITRGAVYCNAKSEYPDPYCICLAVSSKGVPDAPTDGDGLYLVTCQYGRPVSTYMPPAVPYGELRYWVEHATSSEPADHDISGGPLVNSAGEPLEPPPYVEVSYDTLVIQWVRRASSYGDLYQRYRVYKDTVNSMNFYGAGPHCMKARPVNIEEVDRPGTKADMIKYFRLTARFDYREEKTFNGIAYGGWLDVRYDRGRRTVGVVVEGKREYPPIMFNGQVVADPVMLDGSGQQLPDGQQPVVLVKHLYKERNFNEIVIS